MKTVLRLLLFVLLSIGTMHVLSACSSDDEPEKYIYPMTIVDDASMEFHIDSKAQQVEVGIRTNQEQWTFEFFDGLRMSDQGYSIPVTWIGLANTRSDVVPRTLVFQVEANDGEARKVHINIWSGGEPWTKGAVYSGSIEIYQAGAE